MSLDTIVDYSPYFFSRECVIEAEPETLREIQELRYAVYCEECKFIPSSNFPNRRETDRFDTISAHFCAFNKSSELVGYSRLVRATDEGRFPMNDHCKVYASHFDLPPASATAEVSRMIVRSDYRRRRGDRINGSGECDGQVDQTQRRSNSPQILLSLYRQMYQYSGKNNILNWYAAMERPVARALTRIGAFSFVEIGPEEDYFGPVVPYLTKISEIEDSVARHNPAMLAWLTRQDSGAATGNAARS